jgi:uncharacterized protein (TIGR03067 family)
MSFCAALVLLAAPLAAAEAPGGDAVKKDLEQMRGTWVLVSLEEDGKTATEARRKEFRVSIAGARFAYTVGSETVTGFYKLDPTKTPRAMDIVLEDGPNQGKVKLAIYDFDGDTFKVAVAEPGKDRPKGFTAGAEYNNAVWKRVKP